MKFFIIEVLINIVNAINNKCKSNKKKKLIVKIKVYICINHYFMCFL